MPPHPGLLMKIRSGELPTPFVLQHIDQMRKEGMDAPWSAPRSGQQPMLLKSAVHRTFGPAAAPTGTWRVLAILLQFPDKPAQVNAAFFDTLLFGTGGNTLREYYRKASYGSLDIVTANPPGSLGWVMAPHPYSYYANGQNGRGVYPNNAQKMVEDAVAAVDSMVDMSPYDNDDDGFVDAVMVIHTGSGAELTGSNQDIWSHAAKTSLPEAHDGVLVSRYCTMPEFWLTPGDMTIGVYAHELGHAAFGLPDLYDKDNSSEGVGEWSLMASGSWNGTLGDHPASPDAYSRIQMGFAVPSVVTANVTGYLLHDAESTPEILRLWSAGAPGKEYFLAENRQRTGNDTALPSSGLLIYHVDESVSTMNILEWYPGHTDAGHYLVALEQADGQYHLEKKLSRGDSGDPYPGATGNRSFDFTSAPDSRDYSFNPTGVAIRNIGDSGPSMSMDIEVTPPDTMIALISPRGGERWKVGAADTISWISGKVATLRIEYSADNGGHWTTVATAVPATPAKYAWTVPASPSSACLVRLTSEVSPTVSAVSSAPFAITLGATAETEPNNTTASANRLIYGDSLDATLGTADDVDYFAFAGAANDTVVIRADDRNGSALQGEIRLFDNGGTLLASNSSYGSTGRSKLVFRLPADGLYFIRYAYLGNLGTFPGAPPGGLQPLIRVHNPNTLAAEGSGDYRILLDRFRPSPPEIFWVNASDIFSTQATITAEISPNGSATSVVVEYWSEGSGTHSAPAAESPLTGLSPVVASAPDVQGFSPGALNHFRIVASNSAGTTASADYVLTTPPASDQWTGVSGGTPNPLADVSFPDASHGTAVGAFGTILRTTNGGLQWSQQSAGTTASLYGVSFADRDHGIAVGDNGLILRTTDGGQSWTGASSPTAWTLNGVSFSLLSAATAVGYNGTIVHSTDGGATWSLLASGTSSALYGVSFRNPQHGIVAGDAGSLLITTDGGTTWKSASTPATSALRGVGFADSLTALSVGDNGTIIRTSDGGSSWSLQTSPATSGLKDVCYLDHLRAIAVGDAGTMISTADGGLTWTSMKSGTFNSLAGIVLHASESAIVVGDYGTILLAEGSLPVELSSFAATIVSPGGVQLRWTTASEINNYGFQVQRGSTAGGPYYDVQGGFLPGHGTSTSWHDYQFVDTSADGPASFYRLKQIDLDGTFRFSEPVRLAAATDIRPPALPSAYDLGQNYPNPFNPTTVIPFSLPRQARVRLDLFNVVGERVATLVDDLRPAGFYAVRVDAARLPSGMYIYRIRANDFVQARKMLVIR